MRRTKGAIAMTIAMAGAVTIGGMATAVSAAEVVALGASNTYGKGVARGQDYPAQLQALLAVRGVRAKVANAGINGDTTDGMASRFGRVVAADTRVLVLQPGGNDVRHGMSPAQTEANVAAIREAASKRGIRVVTMPNSMLRGWPHQSDGQHLTPEGYAGLAQAILPEVVSALGR